MFSQLKKGVCKTIALALQINLLILCHNTVCHQRFKREHICSYCTVRLYELRWYAWLWNVKTLGHVATTVLYSLPLWVLIHSLYCLLALQSDGRNFTTWNCTTPVYRPLVYLGEWRSLTNVWPTTDRHSDLQSKDEKVYIYLYKDTEFLELFFISLLRTSNVLLC